MGKQWWILKKYEPAVGRAISVGFGPFCSFYFFKIYIYIYIYLIQVTLIQYVLQKAPVSNVAEIKPRNYLLANTAAFQ